MRSQRLPKRSSASNASVADDAVLAMIMAVNAGTETLQELAAEQAPELADILADKEMITPFFDLVPINGGIQTDDGKYLVTLSVPTLTEGMTDVRAAPLQHREKLCGRS